MRKAFFIALFAAVYTLCTVYVSISAVGAAMSGFEPGTTAVSQRTIHVLGAMSDAMTQPLVPLLRPRGLWAYPLIFGNGVLWGSALVALWSGVRRYRGRAERLRAAA